jgi:hypothetical protein
MIILCAEIAVFGVKNASFFPTVSQKIIFRYKIIRYIAHRRIFEIGELNLGTTNWAELRVES